MTYEEAAETTVTKKEAFRLISDRECDPSDFVEDNGDHATYSGEAVLAWLGF